MVEQPEIIPPGRPQRRGPTPVSDEALDQLATVLDELFHIPGTRIRFGLDTLIGLIPGIGDAISGLVSSFIIVTAHQRGLPKVTLARMAGNVLIDSLIGSVPLLGDLFDVGWKANRRNVNLLKAHTGVRTGKQRAADTAFVALMIVVVLGAVALPFALLWWVARALLGY